MFQLSGNRPNNPKLSRRRETERCPTASHMPEPTQVPMAEMTSTPEERAEAAALRERARVADVTNIGKGSPL